MYYLMSRSSTKELDWAAFQMQAENYTRDAEVPRTIHIFRG